MDPMGWLDEPHIPVGDVDPGPGHRPASRLTVILSLLAALALLGGLAWGIHHLAPALSTRGWGMAGLATLIYLALAHVLRPEPDHSDMGLMGGLIDNPFSWSDDYNRFLFSLQITLFPGRFIARSLLSSIDLFRHA